jgi:hypothetical protein
LHASPARIRALLVLYGVVVCLVGIRHYSNTLPPLDVMSTRVNGIAAAIETLDRGGPPLLGSKPPWGTPGLTARNYVPVGVGDDQGAYLYLSYLGHWTGERTPQVLIRWAFIGLMSLLLLVYPLLFYELFGSTIAGVLAPLLVVWKFGFLANTDIYWVTAWGMLLCLPAVALAYTVWPRGRGLAIGLLVGSALVASFVTSVRIHAGLPILLAGLGVAVARGRRRWSTAVVAAGLVLSYFAISTGALSAVRAYRDHVVSAPGFDKNLSTQHPFWHNAYIGLGYLPNRFGITWDDSVSADAVQRVRPGTPFLSAAYERTLRHLYFRIARQNPGLVLRNLGLKFRAISVDVARHFWPVFLVLPAALLLGRRRTQARIVALVSAPALALGAVPPSLTLPVTVYEMGWLGAWGFLWIASIVLLACGVVSALPAAIRLIRTRTAPELHAPSFPGILRSAPGKAGLAAALGCLLLVVLLGLGRPVPPPNPVGEYRADQSGFAAPSAYRSGAVVASWRFPGTLPSDWNRNGTTTLTPSSLSPGAGLAVRTPDAPSATQLASPWQSLPAGRYRFLVTGRVLAGGIGLDVRSDDGRTLASSRYWGTSDSWSGQQFGSGPMAASFTLDRPTRVSVSLSSWAPVPLVSRWTISRAAVVDDAPGK